MNFKIKITSSDYIRLMFLLRYRKPYSIFVTILGFVMLALSIRSFSGEDNYVQQPVILMVFCLMIIIGVPISLYLTSKRNFNSNYRLQEEIECELSNDNMKMRGETFNTESDLNQTYKIEELKNWFLLFQNRTIFNLIPKKGMTVEEINTARNIFRNVKNNRTILKLK